MSDTFDDFKKVNPKACDGTFLLLLADLRATPGDREKELALAQWLEDKRFQELAAYAAVGGYSEEVATRQLFEFAARSNPAGRILADLVVSLRSRVTRRLAASSVEERPEPGPVPEFHMPPRR